MDSARRVSLENDPILRQAVDWYVELESPDIAMERISEWERWLSADERHARAFDRIAALQPAMERVRAHSIPSDADRAADAYDGSLSVSAWRWRKKERVSELRTSAQPRHRRWLAASLAAATLVAVAALLGIYPRQLTVGSLLSLHLTDTKAGETRRVTLVDGSTVFVGGRSSLWIVFTPRARRVALRSGEAFFEVAQNPSRPFTVHAGRTAVTAVGTAFNVRRTGERVVVAVAEGVVTVVRTAAAAPAESRVPAGQQASFDPSGSAPVVLPIDASAVAGWRNGRLQYMNEPLANIVADIRRYSVRDIEISDARIAELQVTGVVFEHNIDLWLQSLETMFPIRVEREPAGRIRLEAAERP